MALYLFYHILCSKTPALPKRKMLNRNSPSHFYKKSQKTFRDSRNGRGDSRIAQILISLGTFALLFSLPEGNSQSERRNCDMPYGDLLWISEKCCGYLKLKSQMCYSSTGPAKGVGQCVRLLKCPVKVSAT